MGKDCKIPVQLIPFVVEIPFSKLLVEKTVSYPGNFFAVHVLMNREAGQCLLKHIFK